jgi:hypothetical protein
VSRLYDRVLANRFAPITYRNVLEAAYTLDERRETLAEALRQSKGREPAPAEVEDLLLRSMTDAADKASSDTYDRGDSTTRLSSMPKRSPTTGNLCFRKAPMLSTS